MPDKIYHLNEKQIQQVIGALMAAERVIMHPLSSTNHIEAGESCWNTVKWLDDIKPVTEGAVDEIAAAFIADDRENTNG